MQIKKLVERITQQQKDMGYHDLCRQSKDFRMAYIRDITLALQKEVSEFLDEVPWKPWKAVNKQALNENAAALELMDIIVFTIVLYVTLHPKDADIDVLMDMTMNKIENRIKSGYGLQESK